MLKILFTFIYSPWSGSDAWRRGRGSSSSLFNTKLFAHSRHKFLHMGCIFLTLYLYTYKLLRSETIFKRRLYIIYICKGIAISRKTNLLCQLYKFFVPFVSLLQTNIQQSDLLPILLLLLLKRASQLLIAYKCWLWSLL